jgi:hypothetical protein
MEDMDKFPNSTIHIDFEGGPPLSLEALYEICRPVSLPVLFLEFRLN